MFYEKNTTLVTDQRSYNSFYHICETINYTGQVIFFIQNKYNDILDCNK